MSCITKIEVCKKNKERVNVFVDDEFAFSCSSEVIYYQGLKNGDKVDMEKMSIITDEDNYMKCKSKALKHIERSYKTEKQIYDYLLGKEFDEKTISRVMSFMYQYSFIDDEKYAQMYFKDRIKKEGMNKIKFDLKKKGIQDNIIESIICESNNKESEGLITNGEKKIKLLLNNEKDIMNIKRKLYDHLVRKGYAIYNVKSCVNTLIEKYESNIVQKEEEKENYDFEKAFEIAEKRYNILAKSEGNTMKLKKKLYDFLVRRGYSYDIVNSVIKELI